MVNVTDPYRESFRFIFSVAMLSLFIAVAFIGNLVVLVVFAYTKELQTVMNYFLVSLAVADLFTSMFPLPLWMVVKVYNRWPFDLHLYKVWQCTDLILCTSSIWNLCAISVDRCLAIALPFAHRVMLTPFRMKCAVLLVWLYSISQTVLITDLVHWQRRGVLISCLSFYIPSVIIIAAYFTIFISEQRARLELRRQVVELPLRNRYKQELKMAKYLMLLIVCFLLCWVGHFALSTHFALGGTMPNVVFADAIKAATYLNSCLNPFLYGYVSPKFRTAFYEIIRHRGRRVQNKRFLRGLTSPMHTISRKTSSTKLEDKTPRSPTRTSV